MKIMTICGSGLGSSFMVQMNIEKVLGELGVTGVEVDHSDVSNAFPGAADVFVVSYDIAQGINPELPQVVLNSIIDMDELREKITKLATDHGLI